MWPSKAGRSESKLPPQIDDTVSSDREVGHLIIPSGYIMFYHETMTCTCYVFSVLIPCYWITFGRTKSELCFLYCFAPLNHVSSMLCISITATLRCGDIHCSDSLGCRSFYFHSHVSYLFTSTHLLNFLERPWVWCCIRTQNGISSGKISRTTMWCSIVSVPKTK